MFKNRVIEVGEKQPDLRLVCLPQWELNGFELIQYVIDKEVLTVIIINVVTSE
jgi:hypothetical protein